MQLEMYSAMFGTMRLQDWLKGDLYVGVQWVVVVMTMVAVACLSCGGGGSVSDGEQGCEDDGFRV